MFKIFKRRDKTERKGSALLIVLGFLSFMIISAVAFAVYMRVERQASSNYRHSSSARHLLNAALFRAIDEIDSELRATSINGSPNKRKFPDWPGRVRNSAVVNSDDNEGDARVLTLDALSYIPAILVNDVRANATKPYNPGGGTYEGPKWRTISTPDRNMDGDPAYREAVVGRYAYSCINVSDMLNVNACKASVRDIDRYRVSLAHLFSSDTTRDAFDNNVENTDHRYSTLNDFYACMQQRNDLVFGSPYHYYLSQGDDVAFDDAVNHVLITDGRVLAEPANLSAFNLQDGAFQSALTVDPPVAKADFMSAMNSAVANSSANFSGQYQLSVFPYLLGDYLDDDNIPTSLDVPSVELAPMVCKLDLTPQTFNIFKTRQEDMDGDGNPETVVYIDIMSLPPQLFGSVKTIYPFLRTDYRSNLSTSFEIDINAFLRIHSEPVGGAGPCSVAPGAPSPGSGYFVAYKNTPAANSFTPSANARASGTPYNVQSLDMNIVPLPGMPNTIDLWNSLGGAVGTFMDARFPAGQEIRITLYITFLGIKESGSNEYVDAVPAFKPVPPTGVAAALQTRFVSPASPHKLYFETTPSPALNAGFNVNLPMTLKWTGLETPDPRFNYKISNWVQDNTPVNPNAHNASTLAFLNETPNTGRDTDIYMSVSNTEELYSPGELGFIIRPFNYTPMAGPAVNFNLQLDALAQCEDRDAMFRTYRLYDHGNPAGAASTKRHDDLYEWFYSSNPDGTFNGMRVNPLSDIPLVLGAASENIPFDYWLADEITERVANGSSIPTSLSDRNYSKLLAGNSWARFTNGWYNCLVNARNNTDINTDLDQNLRDIYYSNDYFGWYSESTALTEALNPVSAPSVTGLSYPINLSQDLYGVDRKMLFSYTLESFSDRQQLFLYIISAEATAASFGARARSLAGGRAIALVWRDPYPSRSDPSAAPVLPANMFYNLISPWHQYYVGSDDQSSRKTDNDPDSLARDNHFYDHKILYFKYLDR